MTGRTRFPRIAPAFSPFTSFALLVLLITSPGCSGGGGGGIDDEDTDTTPPDAVSDLVILDITTTTVALEWTAPADHRDDGSSGPVDAYDLRRSDVAITGANFAQATAVSSIPAPLPAGQRHRLDVAGLTPGTRYWFALKSRDDLGNWSALSDCPYADCRPIETVTFTDAALEQAMRDHCHKPTGAFVSSDVDTLRRLVAPAAGIVSLSGLEYCASLAIADLRNNDIVDLTPLHGLQNLRCLYVGNNEIASVQPLAGLLLLGQLHLNDNPVTDLQPLASLPALQQLVLSHQAVTDWSPLYDLEKLDDIYLAEMDLHDIGFLAQLRHLRLANLAFNQIEWIGPLSSLTALEAVVLMQNRIVNVGPLAVLPMLREVNLANNLVADVFALVDNPGLGAGDVVRLDGNPLSATALAVQIPALEGRGVQVIR